MKKIVLSLTVFCITSIALFSQIENLDSKNGLFEFKFGSKLYQHQSKLNFVLKGDDGVDYYKYIGKEHRTVLGEQYDEIILGFYRNELYFINVTYRLGGTEFETYLLDKFEQLFGKGQKLNVGESATWAYGWETLKNYAQLVKDEYANLDPSNYGKTVLIYYSKSIQKKIIDSDF